MPLDKHTNCPYKEKAEKLEDACNDAAMQLMRAQKAEMIVERLKKRIEELKKTEVIIVDEQSIEEYQIDIRKNIRNELQKILGDKQ